METILSIVLVAWTILGFIGIALWIYARMQGHKKCKGTKYRQNRICVEPQPEADDDDLRFSMAPLGNLDEEYLNLFANPPMDKAARRGKSAYLRDAYHERIRQIVNALNMEGVNISSYVDMVLTDHLMRYEDQIDHLLHNCTIQTSKKKKLWQPS